MGVLRQTVVEVVKVDFLFARYKRLGQVQLRLEVEMPPRGCMFRFLVGRGTWKRALSPCHARDIHGDLGDIGMGDHAAYITTDEVSLPFHAHVFVDELMQILG